VTGQKVWTSGAAHSDFCFCFVRTEPEAPKHRGISVLVIDMRSPGVDVRPMPELTDRERADFNEVFFDGVSVPRENLVGPLNQGWSMAAGSLAHERGMLWTSQAARLEQQIDRLRELARTPGPDGRRLGEDAVFRDRVAALYVDIQALRCMGYRGFAKFAHGEAAPEHSVLKLFGSEIEQRLCLVALEAQGVEGLDVDWAGFGMMDEREPPWANRYLYTFANTIAGGTSEIQRNIIAQRVLGLPRS
jgi:alkylation response protein AidB-like acyl-CoA dehydrogenase